MSHAFRQSLLRPAIHLRGSQTKRLSFFIPHPRPPQDDPHGPIYKTIHGAKIFRVECGKWVDEWREAIKLDRAKYYANQVVPQYHFKYQKDRDFFRIATDSDYGHGFSKGEFVATDQGTALFRGFLDTRLPKDGKTQKAGYVALHASPTFRSFQRRQFLDWAQWSHLVIRCRGDGRHYIINLHMLEEDDFTWHLHYQFPLYTRGGPYWQLTNIPFSKFFLSFQGALQDRQYRVDLSKITKISITLMDKLPGPFALEIDFIGCMFSGKDEEDFAYETYETPDGYGHAYGQK